MLNETNQQRIRNLYQMLFEMATGNFTFRIQKFHEDELDKLGLILNSFAEKMQTTIQSNYIIPHYTYQNLVQMTFILDKQYNIESFSNDAITILEYNVEDIFNTNFDKLLFKNSTDIWNHIKKEISSDENFNTTIQLEFITKNNLVIPTFCTVSKLWHSDKIIINTVTTILQDLISDIDPFKNSPSKKSDTVIIQNVYKYILNHLEEQLPSTNELSKIFGTNEFKLKEGFRNSFKTSIYQLYNDERLKKAQSLIQQTTIPLKEIAFMSGFNDYVNFSKAFKKKFHYAPSTLHRNDEKK